MNILFTISRSKKNGLSKVLSIFLVITLILPYSLILTPTTVRAEEESVSVETSSEAVVAESAESSPEEQPASDVSSSETESQDGGTAVISDESSKEDDTQDPALKPVGDVLGDTKEDKSDKDGGKMITGCHVPNDEGQFPEPITMSEKDWTAVANNPLYTTLPCPKWPGAEAGNGTIQVCKIVMDKDGEIIAGSGDAVFTMEGTDVSPSISTGDDNGVFSQVSFDLPLSLNADLVGSDGINDAECSRPQSFPVGNYYYSVEGGIPATGWENPKYYDYFDPVFSNVSQFAEYSDVLFDDNASNDDTRNIVSDRHLPIYWNGMARRVVVLNQQTEDGSVCEDTDLIKSPLKFISNVVAGIPNDCKGHITIIKKVVGSDASPADFTLDVIADNPSSASVTGSESGVEVTVDPSFYQIVEEDADGDYITTYSAGCDGKIAAGEEVTCTVTNTLDTGYGPYCGDNIVNQPWEQCDSNTDDNCNYQCQNSDQCNDKVFAKVNVDDIQKWGTGNMTSDVFVGGAGLANRIPSSAWFLLNDGTNWVTDADISGYENVPGFAVERSEANIKLQMHGSHPHGGIGDETEGEPNKEHADGYLSFVNATPTLQVNEVGQNKVEKPFDGIDNFATPFYKAGDDTLALDTDANNSKFWLTVTTADDTFNTNLSSPIKDCKDDDSKTTIKIIKHVVGGSKTAADFTMDISALNPSTDSVTGSETGVIVTVDPAAYQVVEEGANTGNYVTTYSPSCSGTIAEGEAVVCTVTNTFDTGTGYAPYCGDGAINQAWEQCDGGESCTAQCQTEGQCTDKAFAQITITRVVNTVPPRDQGNMSTDIFIGGDNPLVNRIPSGTWFELYDGTNYLTDPTMDYDANPKLSWSNVPGLAVERQAGSIRANMYGYFSNGGLEHSEGYIEYFNVTPTSQASDDHLGLESIESWKLENWHDGIKGNPQNDELWIANNKSYFWLGVQPAGDAFYNYYSEPSQDCDNGGGNGENCTDGIDNDGDGLIDAADVIDCPTGGGGGEGDQCVADLNLIENGGFEAPIVTGNGGDWEIVSTTNAMLKWVAQYLSANVNPGLELQAGFSGWTPKAGDQFAELDGTESTKIYQDIATIPGKTYSIAYSFSPRPGVLDNTLSVGVDGTEIDTHTLDGSANTNTLWEDYTKTFVATGTTTRVSFENKDTSDSLGTFVDEVSVKCVPSDNGGGNGGGEGGGGNGGGGNGGGGNGGGSNGGGSGGGGNGGGSGGNGSVNGASSDNGGQGGGDGQVLGAALATTGTPMTGYIIFAVLLMALTFMSESKKSLIKA